jgi:mannose-1-phosphate guanylyltransferase / mannose-6-phosphate isomerase
MSSIHTIILAGGIGTRLWPLSRQYYPKQFLKLGDLSLFQQTYRRALRLSRPDEIFIVTNKIHHYLVVDQIEEMGYSLPEGNLLLEPAGKSTLPAIAWAMQRIREKSEGAIAAVFPSDHLVDDEIAELMRDAAPIAATHLVTFGVTPTAPHTGYGYIRPGRPLGKGALVEEFREKPDRATAEEYVKAGYLWNSGMFLLKADLFFSELEEIQPEMYRAFQSDTIDYTDIPSISIDYGLLERSDHVAVIPISIAWSDLGDFKALYDIGKKDARGNVGNGEYIDSRDNYVSTNRKKVGLIGVNDLVVVDTDDALLVCDKKQTDKVKRLVEILSATRDPITEYHLQSYRPWGSYIVLENSPFYKIKRVTVKPGKKLSLQMHHHRSEHWIVVSGMAEIDLDGKTTFLRQGESTFVPSGIMHRLKNPGKIPLEVIEIGIGEYLQEDDITRFEDEYGRLQMK